MFKNFISTQSYYNKNDIEYKFYESKYCNNGTTTESAYKETNNKKDETSEEVFIKKTKDNKNNIIKDEIATSINKSNWNIKNMISKKEYQCNYYYCKFKYKFFEMLAFIN